MTSIQSIEVEGATVEQAIHDALAKLEAEEDEVVIEVLSTPRAGLLGLGARRARVRVTRRAERAPAETAAPASRPATAPPAGEQAPRSAHDLEWPAPPTEDGRLIGNLDEQAREALGLVKKLLELMGEQAEVSVTDKDEEGIAIDIKADGSGVLIGRHGQTLDAMEYLVNRLLARRIKDAVPAILDVATYRARRRQQLERMALSMGERAKRERQVIAMEPMAPRDRRVVHLALKDDPMVTTRSVGSGYVRALEIVPTEGGQPAAERAPNRRRQARPQAAEPVGQQGGFKRGQKRI